MKTDDQAIGARAPATTTTTKPEPMALTTCPGFGRCFTMGGAVACREHGCRVCGALVRPETQHWPAPLCEFHAPAGLLGAASSVGGLLARALVRFDGLHRPGCVAFTIGRGTPPADEQLELASDLAIVRRVCSCGALELRKELRHALDIFAPPRGLHS